MATTVRLINPRVNLVETVDTDDPPVNNYSFYLSAYHGSIQKLDTWNVYQIEDRLTKLVLDRLTGFKPWIRSMGLSDVAIHWLGKIESTGQWSATFEIRYFVDLEVKAQELEDVSREIERLVVEANEAYRIWDKDYENNGPKPFSKDAPLPVFFIYDGSDGDVDFLEPHVNQAQHEVFLGADEGHITRNVRVQTTYSVGKNRAERTTA